MSKDYVVTITAREKAELLELPADEKPLAGDELTGRTIVSMISPGTELGMAYLGDKFPGVVGYAAVFRVDKTGADVKDIKPGDVVFCTGPNGVGGHRSVQRVPRIACIPVPDGLAPETAVHARMMCVSMSTLTTTAARPPDKVLVTGLGPVGHLAAQIFQSCGYRVTAVDPVEARRKQAERKGVGRVLPAVPLGEADPLNGFALVVECSSHEQAVLEGCRVVRKRGEVVVVGVPRKRFTEIYAQELLEAVFRGYVTLRSGWEWEIARHPTDFRTGSVFGNLRGAIQWLAEGRVKVEGLYARMHPRDCQRAYQDLLHRRTDALSVVFDWTQA